ncbi:hypothetical protein KKF34_04375 [Myxococcota bacterium]|nr:hypothetical protein [Myxococcota bacterium]MBU1380100.1 hypothetical protein [Myxococcota bacterium]MBU1496094.1 hypothetical protein [Myxococcota bacterium]
MFQIRSIPLNVKSEMTSKVIENMRSNYSDNSNALEIINLLETRLEEIKKATVARDFVEITAELVKADLDRDNAYRSVVRICEGYLSAGVGHAGYNEANEIYNELGSDGLAFLQGSMHAESDIIRMKISWLRAPQRSAAINTLHLESFVQNLEATQDEFDRIYNSRKEKLDAVPERTPIQLAKDLNGALRLAHSWLSQMHGNKAAASVFAPLFEAATRYRAKNNKSTEPTPA